MIAAKLSWLHRILAILIGDVVGTVIFIGGPIAIARLQGHTAADAMWMLERLPEFILVVAAIGAVPALLLALVLLRRMPAIWWAIIMGVLVALSILFGSIVWLAFQTNIWEPVFLNTLVGAALNHLLLTLASGAVAGLVGWCYLMLTVKRPPQPYVPLDSSSRSASTRTIH